MSIAIRDLTALDPLIVADNLAQVEQRLVEANPNLELRRGVLHDLLAYFHALLGTGQQQNVNDYLSGRSLLVISADPSLAPPEYVDDILSNFRVLRKPGTFARGEVTIVRTTDISVTIAVGAVFESQGKRFITESAFTAKSESALINDPTDRLITQMADGSYAFTIDVVAEAEGVDYRLAKDVLVVPLVLPPSYLTSYAASDFLDGRDIETNEQLINRLQQGIAAKAPSNRVNMAAMLRDIEAFSRIQALSIIGYGDAEMSRDKHWIWPMSGGGRHDWYLRSEALLVRSSVTVSATLIAKSGVNGTWQFSFGRDAAAGAYEIANIRPTGAINTVGGFPIVEDLRGYDLSGPGFIPDIVNAGEAAYSRFQTITIRFTDTVTDTVDMIIGATNNYDVEVRHNTLVAEVHDALSLRDVRSYGSDMVVKAAVPCFMQVSFTIHKQSGQDDPDTDAIKDAVCAAVNGIGFIGVLYAGQIYDVVYGYLKAGMSVSGMDLFGRIRYPASGDMIYLRDPDVITIPDAAELMVSAKTVQFYLSPEDIGVSVTTTTPVAS